VSLIELINIHEDSDSDIERFMAQEDLNCSKPDQPFDYVDNLPPCLKDNKEFTGIKIGQRPTMGRIEFLPHNYTFPHPISPAAHCEVCLHWISQYYTDIAILQVRIKSLVAENDLLANENCELNTNAQRQVKRLKRTYNIIIKNGDSVKAVINYDIL
jgi:hypothetical protein